MIDRFNKQQFETALKTHLPPSATIEEKGLDKGEFTYLIGFGSPFAKVELRSSIGPNGISRDDGEDSIRCWLVKSDGTPIQGRGAGKVQTYVNRKKGWEIRMADMIQRTALFGLKIIPCPKCQRLLALSMQKDKVFLYCPTDNEEKNNPHHDRHLPLQVFSKATGEPIEGFTPKKAEENSPLCPTCQRPLVKVKIQRGANAGKEAWSCTAKENGQYLNHFFEVIQ